MEGTECSALFSTPMPMKVSFQASANYYTVNFDNEYEQCVETKKRKAKKTGMNSGTRDGGGYA